MIKIISLFKLIAFAIVLNTFAGVTISHAEDDLGLCPSGFEQETVRTGSVDCFRDSSSNPDRSFVENLRLQREAVCIATPNATVTSSVIRSTSSGSFFSEIICTVARPVPAGTVLCPEDSEEVIRAFDTLVCKYFGSSVLSMQEGQSVIGAQATQCTSGFNGRILMSGVNQETFEEVTFFTTFLSCAREIQATDIIECPYTFRERTRDQSVIECSAEDRSFETIAEANAANQSTQSICTGTTAGLGSVSNFLVGATSNDKFFSSVICDVRIASYGPFADSSVIRACDASCTEEVQQSRACLNGGQIGSTGCTAPSTRIVERRCNTGPDLNGLCPVMTTPAANVVPLLLLDDDDIVE